MEHIESLMVRVSSPRSTEMPATPPEESYGHWPSPGMEQPAPEEERKHLQIYEDLGESRIKMDAHSVLCFLLTTEFQGM